jgi:hypothetical protein
MMWLNDLPQKPLVGNLKGYISLVHSRMPTLPSTVLDELESLEKEIMEGWLNIHVDLAVYLISTRH